MTPKDPVDIPAFASTQLALLDQELQSEILETSSLIANHSPTGLQRAGLALTNLVVSAQRTGFGGRSVVELGPDAATSRSGNDELPEHGLRTGDIVLVAEQPAGSAKKREVKELERKGARGVVTRVQRTYVGVALDEGKEEVSFSGRVWAVKLADEVTYRRYERHSLYMATQRANIVPLKDELDNGEAAEDGRGRVLQLHKSSLWAVQSIASPTRPGHRC